MGVTTICKAALILGSMEERCCKVFGVGREPSVCTEQMKMSQRLAPGLEQEQESGTSGGGPLVFTAAEAFSCAVANSPCFLPFLSLLLANLDCL